MARIIPSGLPRLALTRAKKNELNTLRILAEELPDTYTVFHGVHWARD